VTASSAKDIPEGSHWAILEFDSIFIPGDERSRTNPGHGYPEHTETSVRYIVFCDEASWKQEIERRTADRSSYQREFVALVARRPTITSRVIVELK
jgi:hypothetical protein